MHIPHSTFSTTMQDNGNVIHMEKAKKKKKKKTTVLKIPNQLIKPAAQGALPNPPSMMHIDQL